MAYVAPFKLKKNSVPTYITSGIDDDDTTIPVAETSVFYDKDGTLITKGIVLGYDNVIATVSEEITITGCSTTSGPGNLTGATRGVNADGSIGAAKAWDSSTNLAVMFSTSIYEIIINDIIAHESGKASTAAASTSAAGLVVQATAPSAGLRNVVAIDNAETAYTNKALFDATNPAMNGTASPGTEMAAARRDHVHASDTSRFATSDSVNLADGKSVKVIKALGTDLTSSGIIVTMTAHASLAFGDVCFVNSDGECAKTDADAAATMPVVAMAIATIEADAAGLFLLVGIARNDAWNWTPGAALYADTATAGGLTATAPSGTTDCVQIVGRALTADIIMFKPDNTWVELT
jgi:hypothetical protein